MVRSKRGFKLPSNESQTMSTSVNLCRVCSRTMIQGIHRRAAFLNKIYENFNYQ